MKIVYKDDYKGKIWDNKQECEEYERYIENCIKNTEFYDKYYCRTSCKTLEKAKEIYSTKCLRIVFPNEETRKVIGDLLDIVINSNGHYIHLNSYYGDSLTFVAKSCDDYFEPSNRKIRCDKIRKNNF